MLNAENKRDSLRLEVGSLIRKLEDHGKKNGCPAQISPSLTVVDSSVNKNSMHAAALVATLFFGAIW